MAQRFSLALAQLNPIVGDIEGNLDKARSARRLAAAEGADAVVFSELFITGYPPEDLVLKPALLADAEAAVKKLAEETADGGPAVLMGTPWRDGGRPFNAIAVLERGKVTAVRTKSDLPNYGVFDEKRVFVAGPMPDPVSLCGVRLGLPICEDIWGSTVVAHLKKAGAEFLIAINGSPFEVDKLGLRMNIAKARVAETGLPLVYLNQVGGQDELVFDGGSFAMNGDGALAAELPAWEESLVVAHFQRTASGMRCEEGLRVPAEEGLAAVYQAMLLGLRDYVNKNRFPGVVLGLSGGIDSTLTAVVAVDALGPSRVRCLMMPSRYTARDSVEDAEAVARILGITIDTVPIEPAVEAFGGMLKSLFAGRVADHTEENIQARVRGLILMAVSNKFGPMVLTTGNKSEMSVGYATLYGDMCGGFNVLKDIYKMKVYALSDWRNQNVPKGALGPKGRVVPQRVIEKAPTAELRANQRDEDSLPPYRVLDDILECLIEGEMSFEEVVARGHEPAVVKRVEQMLYVAEYKRRQAPPGVKITRKNFGRDRRYPIVNGFRDAR